MDEALMWWFFYHTSQMACFKIMWDCLNVSLCFQFWNLIGNKIFVAENKCNIKKPDISSM